MPTEVLRAWSKVLYTHTCKYTRTYTHTHACILCVMTAPLHIYHPEAPSQNFTRTKPSCKTSFSHAAHGDRFWTFVGPQVGEGDSQRPEVLGAAQHSLPKARSHWDRGNCADQPHRQAASAGRGDDHRRRRATRLGQRFYLNRCYHAKTMRSKKKELVDPSLDSSGICRVRIDKRCRSGGRQPGASK